MKRAGLLKSGNVTVVNSLVIYLAMPATAFVFVHGMPISGAVAKATAMLFAAEIVMMGAAYVVGRLMRLDHRTTGGLMLAAGFGNTAFLGYPVIRAAFHNQPDALLSMVIIDQFGMLFALNTVGVVVASGFAGAGFKRNSLLEFLVTPSFPLTVLAIILRSVHILALAMGTLHHLAAMTTPLAMISIGLSLSAGSARQYPIPLVAAFALKMVVMPILMYVALQMVGVTGITAKVALVESAMPSAVLAGVFAGRYGCNSPFVAGAVFLSTLASIFLIPGVLMLVR